MNRLIDIAQTDRVMNPLNSFLFTCEFEGQSGDKLFSSSVIEKLKYSVKEIHIPKMKPDGEVKSIQYGSFFLSFPFFSTGEKEMTITFYETDDMMISKILYELQARKRWNTYSLYSDQGADLFVEVVIHDQRNTLSYSAFELFRNRYALVLESFSPPKFSRTGTVQPLTLEATFNTIEGQFGSEKWRKSVDRYAGFDAEDEMNKTAADRGLDREADPAIIDAKDIEARWKKYSDEQMKRLGMIDPVTGGLPKKPDGSIDWDKAYGSTFYGQMAEETQKKLDSQMRTNNIALKSLSESFGRNPTERGEYIASHPESIKELRKTLAEQGVNVNDWSDVFDKLYEMGIVSNSSQHYCQRYTDILNAIVENTSLVKAPTASKSEDYWRTKGYRRSEEKEVHSVQEANKYIEEVYRSGRAKEGDKVIIDYENDEHGNELPGHIVTYLDSETAGAKDLSGLRTGSDFAQTTMTGLSQKKKVKRVRIIRKVDNMFSEEDKAILNSRPGLK